MEVKHKLIIVPVYSDETLRRRFRLRTETVEILVQVTENCPEIPSSNQRPWRTPFPVHVQVRL